MNNFVSIWNLDNIPITRKNKTKHGDDRFNLKSHTWVPRKFFIYSQQHYEWTGEHLNHGFTCEHCDKDIDIEYDNTGYYFLAFTSMGYKRYKCKIDKCPGYLTGDDRLVKDIIV